MGFKNKISYKEPNITKRPLGVSIVAIILIIGVLIDLFNLLLIFTTFRALLLVYKVIGIVGLLLMTSWGFWMIIGFHSFLILSGFAEISIFFLDSNISPLILDSNISPLIIQILYSYTLMIFLAVLTWSSIIIYYLSRKKSFFTNEIFLQ